MHRNCCDPPLPAAARLAHPLQHVPRAGHLGEAVVLLHDLQVGPQHGGGEPRLEWPAGAHQRQRRCVGGETSTSTAVRRQEGATPLDGTVTPPLALPTVHAGFMGGNLFDRNILVNSCRESGDHGPGSCRAAYISSTPPPQRCTAASPPRSQFVGPRRVPVGRAGRLDDLRQGPRRFHAQRAARRLQHALVS